MLKGDQGAWERSLWHTSRTQLLREAWRRVGGREAPRRCQLTPMGWARREACWALGQGRRTKAGFPLGDHTADLGGLEGLACLVKKPDFFPKKMETWGAGQGCEPVCLLASSKPHAALGQGSLDCSHGDPTDQFFIQGPQQGSLGPPWPLLGQLLCLLCPREWGGPELEGHS